MLETITFGYSAMKIWPMAAAIAKPEATNAQPSFAVPARTVAKITAITPKIWVGCGTVPPPITTRVQTHQATLKKIATGPIRRAAARARSRISAVVRSARNVAPCNRHSTTMVTPVISP